MLRRIHCLVHAAGQSPAYLPFSFILFIGKEFSFPNRYALVVELAEFSSIESGAMETGRHPAAMSTLPTPAPAEGVKFPGERKPLGQGMVLTAYGLDSSVRICVGKCVRFFNRFVFQHRRK